ncbi:hypothetical protein A2U01_0005166, partial [Trifolium medium]|nr:hypothetical protein [Trifolium medium]
MTAEGVIKKLPIEVQGHKLEVPVFLLPVAGADVILGASWLATLGSHVADYAALTLNIFLNGKFVTLTGETTTASASAQFHHFKRLHTTDAIAEYFTIQWVKSHELEDIFKELPTNTGPEVADCYTLTEIIFKLHQLYLLFEHIITLYHYWKAQILLRSNLTGIIQPNISPFSSPIILVKKKDGTWRFCTGYNALTIKDSFPIPTVDELLDELFGAKYFSKLDLRSGYHQILVQPEDRYKTAFRTHHGHYECTNWMEHLRHLEAVLKVLQENTLFVKLSKCSFGVKEIEYLGHIVNGEGVSMDKDKVQALLEWPTPQNIKQLRGFLGLTEYYRRFMKSYANLAAPLTGLLKKESYVWNQQADTAFQTLKLAITSAPVLALPNFQKPFALQTPEQQQWLHKFLGYDFIIEYKPGKENIVVDALSRMMALTCTSSQSHQHYTVKEGLLFWKNRIVIPTPSYLIQKLLQEYHNSPI